MGCSVCRLQIHPNPRHKATWYTVGCWAFIVRLSCFKVDEECKEPTNGAITAVLRAGDSAAAQTGTAEFRRGAGSILERRMFMVLTGV